jgi:hypothetical protein
MSNSVLIDLSAGVLFIVLAIIEVTSDPIDETLLFNRVVNYSMHGSKAKMHSEPARRGDETRNFSSRTGFELTGYI